MVILISLLLQITHSSPEPDVRLGVTSPFTDYVKFLPSEFPVSTFYTDDEQDLLLGTSLQDATSQKLVSLRKEFEMFKQSTAGISWCQQQWWDEDTGHITFDDWKLVDAMYRSRALDLPRTGDSMVPLVDMANHAPADTYNARFEIDDDGNVMLVLRDGKSIEVDEEITIQYGAGGACEMVFSYGFLDEGADNAREIYLNLDMPLDDPLGTAKRSISKDMPGVRFYVDVDGQTRWDSMYVYWLCVNKEDGIDFKIVQENNGDRKLCAVWQGGDLDPGRIKETLLSDDRSDIFRLRCVVVLQNRLEEQAGRLATSDELVTQRQGSGLIRPRVLKTISELKQLERHLLASAYDALENEVGLTYLSPVGPATSTDVSQKKQLTASPAVQSYLRHSRSTEAEDEQPEEDYS